MEPGDNPRDRKPARPRARKVNEGKPWSADEEYRLRAAFRDLDDVHELSRRHARTRGAIRSRLRALGLLDAAGAIVRPKPMLARTAPATRRQSAPMPEYTPFVTEHCDDAQLLHLFYRLSMKQRGLVLDFTRMLVARLDRN